MENPTVMTRLFQVNDPLRTMPYRFGKSRPFIPRPMILAKRSFWKEETFGRSLVHGQETGAQPGPLMFPTIGGCFTGEILPGTTNPDSYRLLKQSLCRTWQLSGLRSN